MQIDTHVHTHTHYIHLNDLLDCFAPSNLTLSCSSFRLTWDLKGLLMTRSSQSFLVSTQGSLIIEIHGLHLLNLFLVTMPTMLHKNLFLQVKIGNL